MQCIKLKFDLNFFKWENNKNKLFIIYVSYCNSWLLCKSRTFWFLTRWVSNQDINKRIYNIQLLVYLAMIPCIPCTLVHMYLISIKVTCITQHQELWARARTSTREQIYNRRQKRKGWFVISHNQPGIMTT